MSWKLNGRSARPEVLDVIAGMRAVLREYGERVLIGEIYLPIERLVAYYGPSLTGADLPFNFQLIQTPCIPAMTSSTSGRSQE
jgi:hypothetical protein